MPEDILQDIDVLQDIDIDNIAKRRLMIIIICMGVNHHLRALKVD